MFAQVIVEEETVVEAKEDVPAELIVSIVEEAMVPVANVNVPVATKFVEVAFATCRFVPVALENPRLVKNAVIKFPTTAKRLVEVELVTEALVEKIFVEVEFVPVELPAASVRKLRFSTQLEPSQRNVVLVAVPFESDPGIVTHFVDVPVEVRT